MKVLITGGNGYIARSCFNFLKDSYDVQTTNRETLNLLKKEDVCSFFKHKTFDVVLHTAIAGLSNSNETKECVYDNMLMFENLLACKDSYNKLINFGSGAEIFTPETPYGLSKKIINKLIQQENMFYNIRIFGVFDENELSTRFIKRSILSCKDNKNININQNRLFDFFYMKDLLELIKFYITSQDPPKITESCYKNKQSLLDVALYICKLFYKDPDSTITIHNSCFGEPYLGSITPPELDYVGLHTGINQTFELLMNS